MARNVENLRQLRRVVESAPEERFHMRAVVERARCGTARCALGWCLVDPYFRDHTPLGRFTEYRDAHIGEGDLYRATLQTFGLSPHAADLLFASDADPDMDPHAVPKAEVLANIDRAIAGQHLVQYEAIGG